MLAVKGEPLLPGLEQEALAQFQQESLELADDRPFQVGFGIAGLFGQAEELQDQRFLEEVLRLADDRTRSRGGKERRCCAMGEMSFDGGGEVLEDVTFLQTTGFDCREHPLHESTASGALGSE